jgi:hypothetical protein
MGAWSSAFFLGVVASRRTIPRKAANVVEENAENPKK